MNDKKITKEEFEKVRKIVENHVMRKELWSIASIMAWIFITCGVVIFTGLYIYRVSHPLMSDLAIAIKYPILSISMPIFIFLGILLLTLKEKFGPEKGEKNVER